MSRIRTLLLLIVIITVVATLSRLGSSPAASSLSFEPLFQNPTPQLLNVEPDSGSLYPFPPALLDRLEVSNQSQLESLAAEEYTEFLRVTDEHESISVSIPTEWQDIQNGHWVIDGREVGIFITASANLNRFGTSDEPGVFFGVSNELAQLARVNNPALQVSPAILQLLSEENASHQNRCSTGGRFGHQDNFTQGQYDLYLDCVDGGIGEIVMATIPPHQQYLIFLRIAVRSMDDLYAATEILNSYQVLNSSLADDHGDHEH